MKNSITVLITTLAILSVSEAFSSTQQQGAKDLRVTEKKQLENKISELTSEQNNLYKTLTILNSQYIIEERININFGSTVNAISENNPNDRLSGMQTLVNSIYKVKTKIEEIGIEIANLNHVWNKKYSQSGFAALPNEISNEIMFERAKLNLLSISGISEVSEVSEISEISEISSATGPSSPSNFWLRGQRKK